MWSHDYFFTYARRQWTGVCNANAAFFALIVTSEYTQRDGVHGNSLVACCSGQLVPRPAYSVYIQFYWACHVNTACFLDYTKQSLFTALSSLQEDDSEDESQHRAISDHWTFRKRNKKWSRRSRSHLREDSFSSSLEDILAEDSETNGASNLKVSPLLLVTELRTSLTNLDKRGVKTYSFLPGDDQVPKILVGTFPTENGIEYAFDEEATSNGSGVFDVSMDDTPHEVSGDEGLGGDDDDEFFEYDSNTFPRGGIDTFAMDMFSTFESNLVKLRSQSLPDLFSNPHAELYHPLDDDDDNDDDDDPNSSSASVSTSSNLHSSKDSILDDNTLSLETSLPSTPNQEPKQNSSELERKLTTLPTHRKENSLSSEAYESAESEFSRSRPETPSSPQKRIGAGRKIQLSEKWSSSSVPSARRSTEWLITVQLFYTFS